MYRWFEVDSVSLINVQIDTVYEFTVSRYANADDETHSNILLFLSSSECLKKLSEKRFPL